MPRITPIEQQWRDAVLAGLTELRTQQDGVIDRLDKINGRINTHDEQIAKLNIEAAKRQEHERTNGVWIKASWGIVGSAMLIVFKEIISLFLHT
jgi:hypothetical protein